MKRNTRGNLQGLVISEGSIISRNVRLSLGRKNWECRTKPWGQRQQEVLHLLTSLIPVLLGTNLTLLLKQPPSLPSAGANSQSEAASQPYPLCLLGCCSDKKQLWDTNADGTSRAMVMVNLQRKHSNTHHFCMPVSQENTILGQHLRKSLPLQVLRHKWPSSTFESRLWAFILILYSDFSLN